VRRKRLERQLDALRDGLLDEQSARGLERAWRRRTVGPSGRQALDPRMALSSHLEGVMNGMFLVLVGLLWPRLSLSRRGQRWLPGLALYGTCAN